MTGDIDMGSNYLMKLYPSSSIEPLQPFAAFHNRAGIFDIMAAKKSHNVHFTHAAVIRVFGNDRTPFLGGDSKSHTSRLATENLKSVSIGIQGGRQRLYQSYYILTQRRGSGSAVNFLLDVVSFLSKASEHLETDIVILYSRATKPFHDWAFRAISNVLMLDIERSMRNRKIGIKALLALTGRTHTTL